VPPGFTLASWVVMPLTHLLTYMNDHVAGSRTALELLDHLIDAHPDTESRAFFTTLRADIAADRRALDAMLESLGGKPSALREAAGWFGDRLARLKLVADDPGGGGLRHFEALELLALAILGKRSLWRALDSVKGQVPALRDVDFAQLVARAEEQYARAEARRLDAAARALGA
jgi:hypothetical protein